MTQPAPAPEVPVVVLFDDGDLIAVAKPSGVVVHRGWNDRDRPMLQRVRDHVGQRVHLIHRLDRATSGVLLLSRSSERAAELGHAFERGDVHKVYVALVRGHLGRRFPETRSPEGMRIDYPVPKTENGERIDAVTVVRELAESPVERASLVRTDPETGRFHQIRRHLKHLAHPIVGDVRYGDGKVNRHYRERHGLQRLALHAASITFPESDGQHTVRAPLPAQLANVLAELELDTVGPIGGR